jgi:hypothetical protein
MAQQTVGKYLMGIKLSQKNDKKLSLFVIFKREISKFGIGFWLPFGIFYYLFDWSFNTYANVLRILAIDSIVLIVYYLFKGELYWDTIAKTCKQKIYLSYKNKYLTTFMLIGFFALSYLVLVLYNNINNPAQEKLLGFKIPFKRIEYPNNAKVLPYQHFLEKHRQDPKEYLLGLFDKYDIVILCENLHTEDTQWDFIYEVISDPRFVHQVGNIFTEYGFAKKQDKIDSFMHTTFPDDTALAKATATLTRYHSGNFYFFMQKLHKLNQTLPDSLKIREHFTDMWEWYYLDEAYFNPAYRNVRNIPFVEDRDSLMAKIVIDWYKQTKKKCLVITNSRHAFIVHQGIPKMIKLLREGKDNEAQYIYDSFPNQTANVLIHSEKNNYKIFSPLQQGKWNRALKNSNYRPVGFDLKNSPFGNDDFDKYPSLRKPYPYIYADIFDGYIFYKQEEKWTASRPLYERYAAEEEYKYAAKNGLIDTVQGKLLLNQYTNEGGLQLNPLYPMNLYINLYHFLDLLVWFIWGAPILLIILLSLLFRGNRI